MSKNGAPVVLNRETRAEGPTFNDRLGRDRHNWDGGAYFSMWQYHLLPSQYEKKRKGADAAAGGKKGKKK